MHICKHVKRAHAHTHMNTHEHTTHQGGMSYVELAVLVSIHALIKTHWPDSLQ